MILLSRIVPGLHRHRFNGQISLRFAHWRNLLLLLAFVETNCVASRGTRRSLRTRCAGVSIRWALERRIGLPPRLKSLRTLRRIHLIPVPVEASRSRPVLAAIPLPSPTGHIEAVAARLFPRSRSPGVPPIFARALGRPSAITIHARPHGPGALLGLATEARSPLVQRRWWRHAIAIGRLVALHDAGFITATLGAEAIMMMMPMGRPPHPWLAEARLLSKSTAFRETASAIESVPAEIRPLRRTVRPHLRSARVGLWAAEFAAPWFTPGKAGVSFRAAAEERGLRGLPHRAFPKARAGSELILPREAVVAARPFAMDERWRRTMSPHLRPFETALWAKPAALRAALSEPRIATGTTMTEKRRLRLLWSHLRSALWRPLTKRTALCEALAAIESTLWTEMMPVLIPRLGSAVAWPRSIAPVIILRTGRWRRTFAPLAVSLGCSVTAATAIRSLRPASFKTGPAFAVPARLVRPRFPASLEGRIASGTESIRPCARRTIAIAAAALSRRLWIRGPAARIG